MLRTACLSVLLVPAALSGVSYAQGAPGMCQDCYAPAPPPMAAPVAPPELTRKIGIGLHLSSMAIANDANPDEPTELAGGGLQIRYRINPRWELQLALDSLRQHDEDGMPIGPELGSATIGAMLHLCPLNRWDVYLVAAVGGMVERTETTRTSAAQEIERSQVQLGIGLERRWRSLGLSVELRGVGIAPPEGEAAMTTTPRPGSVPTAEIEAEPDQGALFSLAATYFF